MIGKRVEWTHGNGYVEKHGVPRTGSGIVHAIGFDSGAEDSWQDFMILVEMDDGRVISVPRAGVGLRVCKPDPAAVASELDALRSTRPVATEALGRVSALESGIRTVIDYIDGRDEESDTRGMVPVRNTLAGMLARPDDASEVNP